MKAISLLAAVVAGFIATEPATATSNVSLRHGGNRDPALTVSADGGPAERTLTVICEPAEGDYMLFLETPGFAASGLRVRVDGAVLALGSPVDDGLTLAFLLPGQEGRTQVTHLVGAQAIDIESGPQRARFVLGNGAAEVARFRQLCGL